MQSILVQTIGFLLFMITWIMSYLGISALKKERSVAYYVCINTVIWTAYLYVITELLSLFKAIYSVSVFVAWLVYCALCIILVKKKKEGFRGLLKGFFDSVKGYIAKLKNEPISLILMFVLLVLLFKSTVIALLTAPNNWDSMTYHLSRIMFWIENHSVAYYGTNIPRQLVSPPLAEYINMHAILLCGGDRYVNMLQNFSAYGCVVMLYAILRKLNCSRQWTLLGNILMLTMNAFYAETVSTQVDIAGSFYLLMIIFLSMEIMESMELSINKDGIQIFVVLGANIGLLYLIKSNALIPVVMIILFAFIRRISKKEGFVKPTALFMISGLTALMTVIPSLVKNYKYCKDILASDYVGRISTGTLSPGYLFVNVLKNIGIVAVGKYNSGFIMRLVSRCAAGMGIDINAAEISFNSLEYSVYYSTNMDSASAHLIIPLMIIVGIICIYRLIWSHKSTDVFCLILLLQFIVMAAAVRWQPWGVRLLLPSLVVLMIPITYYISLLFDQLSGERDYGVGFGTLINPLVIAFVLILCISSHADSYSYLKEQAGFNMLEKGYALSRMQRYFTYNDTYGYYKSMFETIDTYDNVDNIGLYTGGDTYQYPVMANYYKKKHVQNVKMNAEENKDMINEFFSPDVVFVAGKKMDDTVSYYCNGNKYHCVSFLDEKYSLWEKE